MTKTTEILSSSAATLTHAAAGHRAVTAGENPAVPLILYEFEGCPFCRRVREALSALDLDALIIPCPRGGRHREAVVTQGGRAQFPYLVDVNRKVSMYESDDIINYLSEHYGNNEKPWQHSALSAGGVMDHLAGALRAGRGLTARGKTVPKKPLELYNYEASPYCRLVREVLSELEVPYIVRNVARQSAKRPAFIAMAGKMQVPYLKDPNTDVAMFESEAIIDYLEKTYG